MHSRAHTLTTMQTHPYIQANVCLLIFLNTTTQTHWVNFSKCPFNYELDLGDKKPANGLSFVHGFSFLIWHAWTAISHSTLFYLTLNDRARLWEFLRDTNKITSDPSVFINCGHFDDLWAKEQTHISPPYCRSSFPRFEPLSVHTLARTDFV